MESYLSRHNFIATSFRDRLSIDARFTNSLIAKTELRKITGEALKNLPSPLIDQFQFALTFSFDLSDWWQRGYVKVEREYASSSCTGKEMLDGGDEDA